ncbi:substrate-binding domain-containing protein [bacterium]|nr:substrate-binding domain-containing protein [bacterium]
MFCFNDMTAIGLMAVLQDAGIMPGKGIGIIGFDDIQDARYWRPTLTTVATPPSRLGEIAVDVLLKRIAQPDKPVEHVIYAPQVVVRQSCGCRRRTDEN